MFNAKAPVKRVLIYRLGSLGDMAVALPALHLVERAFPGAERRMVTNFPVHAKAPAAAAVFGESGIINGYFRYTTGTRAIRPLLALWWQIVRWRPDALVYLGSGRGVASARRDATFFRLCGISRQIGVPITEAMQVPDPEPGGTIEYEAQRLLRNISALGTCDVEDPAGWDLRLNEQEQTRAAEVLRLAEGRPVLAVSVGTKVQSKDWGAENWRNLLRVLGAKYPQYALVLFGAPEESDASEHAAQGWRGSAGTQACVLNLCGALKPRESAAAMQGAAMFLGHDSGPMHLAAAVGTPCVAIFAARRLPRMWFPVGRRHRVLYHKVSCANCDLETCIVERKRCILGITVEEVVQQVDAVLGNQLISL